jgi:hypothetical protein
LQPDCLFVRAMKKSRPIVASSVSKTITNAWTTSTRMHECVVVCRGCSDVGDSLKHSFTCQALANNEAIAPSVLIVEHLVAALSVNNVADCVSTFRPIAALVFAYHIAKS